MAQAIIVVEAGWVFVGDLDVDGSLYTVSNALCIRSWGTTMGLGELAINGPQKATVLDPCGTVTIPAPSVLFTIYTEKVLWD